MSSRLYYLKTPLHVSTFCGHHQVDISSPYRIHSEMAFTLVYVHLMVVKTDTTAGFSNYLCCVYGILF